MKRILADTNIYGLLAVDSELHKLHQEYITKRDEIRIYGFSVIRKELKKVPKMVIDGVNVRASLLKAYYYFAAKEYGLEDRFRNIADEYYTAYLSFGGRSPKEKIYNDLLIVACAAVKSIDLLVSEDNATLTSEFFQKAYLEVNKKNALHLPAFIKYKKFKELLLRATFPNPFIDSSNKLRVLLSFFYIFKWVFFSVHTPLLEKLIYKDFAS